ncbi:hypothetical protein ABZ897_61430 [Nonomuraea sp. NPDC046802]|uniref:hypothetical protein n=1 Tax=Nonomuraea sp. NPDC046802 TaxID=3154919 RepID=UPI0033F85808
MTFLLMPRGSYSLAPLIEAAELTGWPRICREAPELVAPVLSSGRRLPDEFIDAALACGNRDLAAALVVNKSLAAREDLIDRIATAGLAHLDDAMVRPLLLSPVTGGRPDVLERVAATGSVQAVHLVYDKHVRWTPRLRRVLFAAATWLASDSKPVEWLLKRVETARPLVVAPAPALVRRVLSIHGAMLTEEEQLRALWSLWLYGNAATAFTGIETTGLCPSVDEVVSTADPGLLQEALARAEGTDGAIDELNDPGAGDLADRLSIREHLDWAAVHAADARQAFGEAASAALAARRDCPDDLRAALYARHPAATVRQFFGAPQVAWEALRALDSRRPLDKDAADLAAARRDCPDEFRADLLRRFPMIVANATIAPSTALLHAATGAAASYASAETERSWTFTEAERSHASVATEPSHAPTETEPPSFGHRGAVSRGAMALLVRHGLASGTLTGEDVLTIGCPAATVLAATRDRPRLPREHRTGAHAPNTWPRFRALLTELVATTLGANPSAWQRLAARLPVFPGTIPELLEAASAPVTGADEGVAVRLPTPGSEGWEAFLSLSDTAPAGTRTTLWPWLVEPDLRALIVEEPHIAEWSALAATTEEIRDAMLAGIAAAKHPAPQRELAACATAQTHRSRLRHRRISGKIPQLRMFLDAWERFGPDAVTDLLNDPIILTDYLETRDHIAVLLARDDGLDALRAEVAEGESPRAQIEAWRRRKGGTLAAETQAWHWPEILREHLDRPFPPDTVWWMARATGCPWPLWYEARTTLPKGVCAAYTQLLAGIQPEKVLTACAVGEPHRRPENWLREAVRAGKVTWAQALEHGHPATEILSQALRELRAAPPGLAELMRDTIKDDAGAWLRAVRLLPDFEGSVADLLRTAAG